MTYREWKPIESHWEEHPKFRSKDWRYEVENDDTRLGYVDWVNSQLYAEEGDK